MPALRVKLIGSKIFQETSGDVSIRINFEHQTKKSTSKRHERTLSWNEEFDFSVVDDLDEKSVIIFEVYAGSDLVGKSTLRKIMHFTEGRWETNTLMLENDGITGELNVSVRPMGCATPADRDMSNEEESAPVRDRTFNFGFGGPPAPAERVPQTHGGTKPKKITPSTSSAISSSSSSSSSSSASKPSASTAKTSSSANAAAAGGSEAFFVSLSNKKVTKKPVLSSTISKTSSPSTSTRTPKTTPSTSTRTKPSSSAKTSKAPTPSTSARTSKAPTPSTSARTAKASPSSSSSSSSPSKTNKKTTKKKPIL